MTGLPMLSARRAEWLAVTLVALLLAVLAFVAPVVQPQDYHRFADARTLVLGPFRLPNAADVLTSLAFVVAGGVGLASGCRVPPPQRLPLNVLFGGLVLTGLGSAWYHLAPSDATLRWDRLAMALAFAGAIGALAGERLGPRHGRRWLLGWLALGLAAVAYWVLAGDLRLYLVAQFGGAGVLLLWFRLPPAAGMCRLPWGWLLLAYAVAKGCEQFDREIWALSDGLVAGHPLKHLAAALGVAPLLRVLRARRS